MSSLLSADCLETPMFVRCLCSVSRKLGSAAESHLDSYTGEAKKHNECTVVLGKVVAPPASSTCAFVFTGHSNVYHFG